MVASLLGAEGYDLPTAYDGETALRRHAEDLPDLVILDRRLPKMTGDEICKRIRGRPDADPRSPARRARTSA
jgi:two-component system phosphate regulon response regulator PhoB